ncbi:MAG: hypothetical protein ACYCXW_12845 [Solirubrobacteraceae bacterium]
MQGSRSTAARRFEQALADYLQLGGVYRFAPASASKLDGQVSTDLHRLTTGLSTGVGPRSLVPLATALQRTVAQAGRVLPHLRITPRAYARRAQAILQSAQQALHGRGVANGAGLLGTAAEVAAAREVIGTLVPLLRGRDGDLGEVQNWLLTLQQAVRGVRLRDGGWPAVSQLSPFQRKRLDETLAGAVAALGAVPQSLLEIPAPSR